MNAHEIKTVDAVVAHSTAVLDEAHIGDIHGAFGSIPLQSGQIRRSSMQRLKTLLAIVGPGLIVMVGDNDAGAFSTYTQAGQDYGISLLWTLLFLVPVLYVNQEMVLRLGVVTGVGHARLIFERFGRFWGAFSVIDLFVLNALTLVTEFIGITMGLDYLGISRPMGVTLAVVVLLLAVSTGSFRRFERFALLLVGGSLLLVPLFVMVHPPLLSLGRYLLMPQLPQGKLSDIMLLIIAIVGTTIAPWQLFFQQSYVIDKRITPAFMKYEIADLWLGIFIVVLGAAAMMGFSAQAFAGHPEAGHFQDVTAVARGLQRFAGPTAGVLFALALIDACIIGAAAVSLSTAYALGDVFSVRHSLHRKPAEAKGFYLFYSFLVVLAAALVLTPGVPLGLLTNLVQSLAGVLLPSATVFLLLLCNDRQVLGPWVNTTFTNVFTALVIAVLVMLSVILTAAVLFPDMTDQQIIGILLGCIVLAIVLSVGAHLYDRRHRHTRVNLELLLATSAEDKSSWRMPPVSVLQPNQLTVLDRVWMGVLRLYLVVAAGMILVKLVRAVLVH